jgi:hypothetical protein
MMEAHVVVETYMVEYWLCDIKMLEACVVAESLMVEYWLCDVE